MEFLDFGTMSDMEVELSQTRAYPNPYPNPNDQEADERPRYTMSNGCEQELTDCRSSGGKS